jgi:hypothetical protein
LKSKENHFVVEAKNSFLLFVRQIREFGYEEGSGVLINQRFVDPGDKFVYQDNGVRI